MKDIGNVIEFAQVLYKIMLIPLIIISSKRNWNVWLNTTLHSRTTVEKLGFRIKSLIFGENFRELELIILKRRKLMR